MNTKSLCVAVVLLAGCGMVKVTYPSDEKKQAATAGDGGQSAPEEDPSKGVDPKNVGAVVDALQKNKLTSADDATKKQRNEKLCSEARAALKGTPNEDSDVFDLYSGCFTFHPEFVDVDYGMRHWAEIVPWADPAEVRDFKRRLGEKQCAKEVEECNHDCYARPSRCTDCGSLHGKCMATYTQ